MRFVLLLLAFAVPMVVGTFATPETPVAVAACTPAVTTEVSVLERQAGGAVALSVVVRADTSRDPANQLSQVRFTGITNASAEAGGRTLTSTEIVTLSPPVTG